MVFLNKRKNKRKKKKNFRFWDLAKRLEHRRIKGKQNSPKKQKNK